ncbi:hypothetical protein ISS06_02370 [Patescibacteria group bacterium]|nr:hypothetical protein [Patescibacteria group bacterium]
MIIGILTTMAGFLIIWKTEWLLMNLGRISWAENHLRTEGGSRIAYKFIGLCGVFLGIFIMTGITNDILSWIAGLFIKK